jgi:polyhydroxyalkanoate synthesis regulator phasin
MMSGLPIPTRKEIDDLEKELYELKKRIRRIEKERQPFLKGVAP